jgi:hypothetical protein
MVSNHWAIFGNKKGSGYKVSLATVSVSNPGGQRVLPDYVSAEASLTLEDMTGIVAFLCTPAAAMIRGQVIVADGDYTLPVPGVIEQRSKRLPQATSRQCPVNKDNREAV